MQVEGQHRTSVLMATGARVSNAYTIYLVLRDSPGKLGLIPHSPALVAGKVPTV